jgi:hypothetical protein
MCAWVSAPSASCVWEFSFCRFGLLHRIPPPAAHLKEGRLPPDMLNDAHDSGTNMFVPADLSDEEQLVPERIRSPPTLSTTRARTPTPGRPVSPLHSSTPARALTGESAARA